jgi:WD40 repeat protein
MQILSTPKKKRIYALAFSPSGQQLAAVCGDGQARIWDLATGQVRQAIGIENSSGNYALAYLTEDHVVVAGTCLRWWDVPANGWNTIDPRMAWGPHLCVSPDGRFLAEADQSTSTDFHGTGLVVRDTAEWERLPDLAESADTTGGLAFSPDGQWLATGHIVRVGEKQRSFAPLPGRYAVPDYDYEVRVRAWPSGQVERSLAGWQQGIGKLAFSPDGKFLAGAAGPRLRIWDLAADREVALHKRGPKHFQGLAFTVNGAYLATVSNDHTVRIWETLSWQEHTTFTFEIGALLDITLDRVGCRAAAGSDKGQIVIWDVES